MIDKLPPPIARRLPYVPVAAAATGGGGGHGYKALVSLGITANLCTLTGWRIKPITGRFVTWLDLTAMYSNWAANLVRRCLFVRRERFLGGDGDVGGNC